MWISAKAVIRIVTTASIIREVDEYNGINRTVVQKTQYYPSGTPFQESYGESVQAYKFTGKEYISMNALNWHDFGARWMDNARMQWTSVDPLAEKYYGISPYAYCMNNPVKFVDPTGMSAELDINSVESGQADAATQALQKSTTLQLNRDSRTGKITATGEAKTIADKNYWKLLIVQM